MGPKSTEWLASVGIHTLDDVAQLGVVKTYERVKAAYPEKVMLNMIRGSAQKQKQFVILSDDRRPFVALRAT